MNVDLSRISLDYHLPVLSAGGSQVRISAKGIEVITGAKFEAKAGQHVFSGGSGVSSSLPALPVLNLPPKHIELNYVYDDLKPVAHTAYKLIFPDGTCQEGVLGAEGYAKVTIPGDKTQAKIYYGFSSLDAKPDQEKVDNPFKDNQVMSVTDAEQLIEQYNLQELDALLDDYFPDEIEDMIDGNDMEFDDHINDYEEQILMPNNNSDDAIADDAKEILLNEDTSFKPKLGDEQ